MLCLENGCDYQLDLDGQVTCSQCGAMDDDKQVIPDIIDTNNDGGNHENRI